MLPRVTISGGSRLDGANPVLRLKAPSVRYPRLAYELQNSSVHGKAIVIVCAGGTLYAYSAHTRTQNGVKLMNMNRSALATTILFLTSLLLSLNVAAVMPDYYQEPGLDPYRSFLVSNDVEFIDPFSGALQLHHVDLSLPGNGGFDLQILRSYNSLRGRAHSSYLGGHGWEIHFGRILQDNINLCYNSNTLSTIDNPVLELPDGSHQMLGFTGTSAPKMLSRNWWRVDCMTGGYKVYSPDGRIYEMTRMFNLGDSLNPKYAWHTTKITDRNGNSASISYNDIGNVPEVSSITTSDGRTVSFTYSTFTRTYGGNLTYTWRHLASISSAGQVYQYSYEYAPANQSGPIVIYGLLSTVQRPDGTTWNYSYNIPPPGQTSSTPGEFPITRVTNPTLGITNYEYAEIRFEPYADPNYVVAEKTVSGGGTWSFSYEPGSSTTYDKTTVASPSGVIQYEHIGHKYAVSGTVWTIGLLVSKTIGGEQTETYDWGKVKVSNERYGRFSYLANIFDHDGMHAPVLVGRNITRNGAVHTTAYSSFDSYGNPGTVTESGPSGSRTSSLTYYINTNRWIVKQPQNESRPGSSISRSFNANGNLTSETVDGVTAQFTYDAQGNIASITHPRSLTHQYQNYFRGIPRKEIQPEGITITRTVSNAGNVLTEVNGEGKKTTYTYDNMNRVKSIKPPTGNTTTFTYTAVKRTLKRGNFTEVTDYDGFARPIAVTRGGVKTTFQYDALGRKTFESNPGATIGTTYVYDILDRPTRITHADAGFRTIAYGYTTAAPLYSAATETVTDERGKVTTYQYRAFGSPESRELMRIVAPIAASNVDIARNTKGLPTSITQAGLTRTYGYNSNYYLTSVNEPEVGTTTYGRDIAGNMTSRKVGASGTTNYTYDNQNRLKTITYPGSGSADVTYTYNKIHKVLSATSTGGNRSATYNANGNMLTQSLAIDGHTLTASYAYNNNDALTSVTYPQSGLVVSYAPDALGRPTQASGFVSAVTYWPSNQIRKITYANGTSTEYGQNARLWPSFFKTDKTGGATYLNNVYTYDKAGNITQISDTIDASYNRTLGYDNLDRLTSISGPWGTGMIAYNGAGNITSQVLGSWNLYYTYGSNNRLDSVSGNRVATYAYDAYGNITSGGGNTYTYDDVPNLRCVNCADPANKVEYTYDGLNHRSSVLKGGVKTYEMYGVDGNPLVEFSPGQQNWLVEYIYVGSRRIAQRAAH